MSSLGKATKKVLAAASTALLVASALVLGVAAPASATEDCVPKAAWTEIISEAVPGVPAVAEVSHTEYQFEHAPNGVYKTRWETDQNWNAESNPNSTGWRLTDVTRLVIDVEGVPAIDAIPARTVFHPAVTCDEPPVVTPAVKTVPVVEFSDACGVANDTVSGNVDTEAIDYTTVDSRNSNGVGTVSVTAAPQPGYTFARDAYTGPWTHDFTNENCANIKPIAPKAVDAACASDEGQNGSSSSMGYIQLDLKVHLQYTIDGQPTSSARNFLGQGTYTVAVTADAGYKVDGPVSWTRTINPSFCPPTFALVSTNASMSNSTCSTQGSYTLADTAGVQWFVNGSATPTAAGTHKVSGKSAINVEAKLIDPVVDGWEDGARTAWTFTFADPTGCLPTLAFTGSNGNTLGLLLIGGLLLTGGVVLSLDQRRRRMGKGL